MKYHKEYTPHHIERLEALRGTRLASFQRRAFAFIIDIFVSSCLLLFGMILYGALEGLFSYTGHGMFKANLSFEPETMNIILELLLPILYAGLLVYFTQGKTVGKWLMGIRIVPITHDRISLLHSIERAMAYATSILEFGFGFAQYFMNPNHRTLCDKVGETIVIREIRKKKTKGQTEPEETVNVDVLEGNISEANNSGLSNY